MLERRPWPAWTHVAWGPQCSITGEASFSTSHPSCHPKSPSPQHLILGCAPDEHPFSLPNLSESSVAPSRAANLGGQECSPEASTSQTRPESSFSWTKSLAMPAGPSLSDLISLWPPSPSSHCAALAAGSCPRLQGFAETSPVREAP